MSASVGEIHTFFGKGAEFEGKLRFDGAVRIDGKFTGEISSRGSLLIGEGARVQADITADTVIIGGAVKGSIHASTSVEINRTARAQVDLETPSISIEKGCVFEGSCRMERKDEVVKLKPVAAALNPPPLPLEAMAAARSNGR